MVLFINTVISFFKKLFGKKDKETDMRLQETFFHAQPFNPYVPPMELIFSKTTAGTFSFNIPANARHVRIEIAGGNGGQASLSGMLGGSGGRGERIVILGDIVGDLAGKTITGTVAATSTSSTGVGGSGAPAGGNGTHTTPGGSSGYGGGGGGATQITVDATTYQASGGGGATFNDYFGGWYSAKGGKGGGARGGNGGISQQVRGFTNGENATGQQLNETSNGYVRVYINAQSNLLFEKTTPGNFSFVIPNTVSNIAIEIAAGNGANGGLFGYDSGAGRIYNGGKGAVKTIELSGKNGQTITGVIGQSGGTGGTPNIAGTPNGVAGQVRSSTNPPEDSRGGGGGGQTECTLSGTQYVVSGGAGGAANGSNSGLANGGAGGGIGGGQPVNNSNGGNATDGDKLNTESFGYIRVFQL